MSELRPQDHVPANRFCVYAPMTGFNSEFAESLESGTARLGLRRNQSKFLGRSQWKVNAAVIRCDFDVVLTVM